MVQAQSTSGWTTLATRSTGFDTTSGIGMGFSGVHGLVVPVVVVAVVVVTVVVVPVVVVPVLVVAVRLAVRVPVVPAVPVAVVHERPWARRAGR